MLRQISRSLCGDHIKLLLYQKITNVQKVNKCGLGSWKSFNTTYEKKYCFRSIHQQNPIGQALVDTVTYEIVCCDTLEALCDYFDELIDVSPHLKLADVTFGEGVLTVNFGNSYGTYVINRQSPNRQIWLSSPKSGPKRYDFVACSANNKQGFWIYKHEGVTLHELLQDEIPSIVKRSVNFLSLSHGKRE